MRRPWMPSASPRRHRFTMWDWVGGRYSVWSAIGLVAELAIGSDKFREFLAGASDIDRHFTTAPFEKNLPVLMGLIAAWNRSFLELPTLAVLPLRSAPRTAARVPPTARDGEQRKVRDARRRARRLRHRSRGLGRAWIEFAAFLLPDAAPGHAHRRPGLHRPLEGLVGRDRGAGPRAAELSRSRARPSMPSATRPRRWRRMI